jgi:hypothetical protein
VTCGEGKLGPVQALVLGFDRRAHADAVLEELRRAHAEGAVCLVDAVLVEKDEHGNLELTTAGGSAGGVLVRALLESTAARGATQPEGGGQVWYLADAIPPLTPALVALIEHHWAVRLRERVLASRALPLADEWIHPADLAAAVAALPEPT